MDGFINSHVYMYMFQRLFVKTYSCLFHDSCFPHGLSLHAIATSYFLSDAAAAVVLLCGVRDVLVVSCCVLFVSLLACQSVRHFLALLLRWITSLAPVD